MTLSENRTTLGGVRTLSKHEQRFSARLSSMRKLRKMTQQQLADVVGLPRPSLGMIEVGKRSVTLSEAVALCEALDVDLAAMISAEPLTLTILTQVD